VPILTVLMCWYRWAEDGLPTGVWGALYSGRCAPWASTLGRHPQAESDTERAGAGLS